MQSTHYISCIRRHWLVGRLALAVYSFTSRGKHALALIGGNFALCSQLHAIWAEDSLPVCWSQILKCPVPCSQLQRLWAKHGAVLLRYLQPVGRPAGA